MAHQINTSEAVYMSAHTENIMQVQYSENG